MKNAVIFALVVNIMILGYLLWDTQQQLSSTQDDAMQFMELAGRASTLTLATTRYSLGEIDVDSLMTVANYYKTYLDSVNAQWEVK